MSGVLWINDFNQESCTIISGSEPVRWLNPSPTSFIDMHSMCLHIPRPLRFPRYWKSGTAAFYQMMNVRLCMQSKLSLQLIFTKQQGEAKVKT